MHLKKSSLNNMQLTATYIYLALPVVVFLLGWCHWYIGIPGSIIIILSIRNCLRQFIDISENSIVLKRDDIYKILSALMIIAVWVGLSGIGGYAWQNDDHRWRNAIFDILVQNEWPCQKSFVINGIQQSRSLVYYIGFWMPSAVVGKLLGLTAGYAAQYLWAFLGIGLVYIWICIWQKKIIIWPLIILIFFSGLDVLGTLLYSTDSFAIWGMEHLERWPIGYQYSSNTTQLFWVFNQAIPIWLATIFIFHLEKPQNIIFTWSLTMLSSTLPFVGIAPIVFYFLLKRNRQMFSSCKMTKKIRKCITWQNVIGSGIVGVISATYLMSNDVTTQSISKIVGKLAGFFPLVFWGSIVISVILGIGIYFIVCKRSIVKKYRPLLLIFLSAILFLFGLYCLSTTGNSHNNLYRLIFLIIFIFLEAGIYLIILYRNSKDRPLFFIVLICLTVYPLIKVGNSIDFCMRASIPALFIVMLWCMEAIGNRKKGTTFYLIIAMIIIGAITPLHEIKRTLINTSQGYCLVQISEEEMFTSANFSGTLNSFFWNYIAK